MSINVINKLYKLINLSILSLKKDFEIYLQTSSFQVIYIFSHLN